MSEMIPNAKEETKPAVTEPDFGELAASPSLTMWLNPQNFAHMQRLAKIFSASQIVPKHFQGETANCMIALSFAFRMGIDPMFAFQNLYVVYGTPGMSTQLMITLANKSGVFRGPIEYDVKGEGEKLTVTAFAELQGSGRKVSDTITLAQARAAGWTRAKDSEKPMWKARPVVMLRYRAAAALIRAYAPEALNGMLVDDELSDSEAPTIDVTPTDIIPQMADKSEKEESICINESDIQAEQPKSGKTAGSAKIETEASWDF